MPPPCQIAYRAISQPSIGSNGWQGFQPRTEHLRKGDRPFQARPLECNITVEHDVEIIVRDGCSLYVDIYRPTDATERIPAILSYSPFGKKYSGLIMLQRTPWMCGVTKEDISGLEKFEGPDPARWCARNFAIVNVDARGAGNSDGAVPIMGTQEGEDGHDVIEAIAKMDWCNGNIGLAGNSHLAIVQYFIAQLQPPSLKAIAPWEGCGDLYREQFVRGGIFNMSNFDLIASKIVQGKVGVEDFAEMYRRTHGGLMNAYWADKRPDMTKIKIPTYITGSEFSSIHTMGSIRAWLQIDTKDKWFRWDGFQEWHSLWSIPWTNEELMDFFDHFLKGKDNGFVEKTPRVRLACLRFGKEEPVQNIVAEDYPVPNTDYRSLYLTADSSLVSEPNKTSSILHYNSEQPDAMLCFTYTFDKFTRLVGMPKAELFMSCDDLDDMCLAVQLRKLDKNGKPLLHLTIPFARAECDDPDDAPVNGLIIHKGSLGLLRASHRYIDPAQSMHPQYPFHPHDRIEKIKPGTVTRLEIGIWAIGVQYEAGESIRVEVSGSNPLWPDMAKTPGGLMAVNKGTHKLHVGGEYPSRVILPFVDI